MYMNQTQPAPLQYTVADAAVYLGLCSDCVYDLVRKELITSRRKGPKMGRIFFWECDLLDYLNGHVPRKTRK